jgi:hypothetical protein
MSNVPTHCIGATVAAAGAVVAATQLHDAKSIPNACIASTIIGVSATAVTAAHHGSFGTVPNDAYCVAGMVVGLGGIGYAMSSHAELSKIPTSCKLYTLAGIAALIAGSVAIAQKN